MKISGKFQFGFLISDVARLLRWNFDRQAQGLGLTRAQWAVLAHLKRCDGSQQSVLARLMDIKPITLARHLDRLEAEGWVERQDDPDDRRAKRVFLTPKSTPMLDALRQLGETVRQEALQGISQADFELTVQTLERIKANLFAANEGSN